MKNSEIKFGTIVKLNPDCSYIKENSSPDDEPDDFFGNPVDCTGKTIPEKEYFGGAFIDDGENDKDFIFVLWDNGQRNCYEKDRENDFIIVE